MRVTISFLLKTKGLRTDGSYPVYVRVTLYGKRFEMSTGINTKTDLWNRGNQRLNGKSSEIKIKNNRLDKTCSNILDIYNQLEASKQVFDVYDIKNRLCGIADEHTILEVFDNYISTIQSQIGAGYSQGTLKHYKTSKNRLTQFIKEHYHNKDIALGNIDYSFINSFDIYLKEKYNNSINTVWGYHKHLKKILNIAVVMDYLVKNPYTKFKVKKQEPKREYLTLLELDKIKNKKIEFQRLGIVRDIFVFACYTGMSYSDIAKLGKQHLHWGSDEEEWIIIDRTKTESRCRIPILDGAKKILVKYENYPVNGAKGLLLPVNSNQKMNAYLKELADICGIKKNLSMHVARHTFATSITLANGVPIETVSKMLGHNSLKTTQIYGRIIDSKISHDMKRLKEIL